MTLRRLESAGPDVARAAVPLTLLGIATVVPWVAGLCLAALVGGVIIAAGRRAPVVWAWAAGVPAAALLAVRGFDGHAAAWDAPGCADAWPVAAWGVGEAVLVAVLTWVLVLALGATTADVGIRRPAKYAVRWAATGSVAILLAGVAAVVVSVPLLGRPLDPGGVSFLLPALTWAVGVAAAEELAWRGVLLGWLGRTMGPAPALLVQAILYGLAWAVLASTVLPAAPVGVAAALAGALLGALRLRTRTVWTGLAWHAALNVPVFVVLACAG